MIEGRYMFKDALSLANDLDSIPPAILGQLTMMENIVEVPGFEVRYGRTLLGQGDIIYWDEEGRILISKS